MDIEATGALASAALVAHEIEPEGGPAETASAHAGSCANCAAPVSGNFCCACGQRTHLHRSILHMGEEFLHGLLHFDAKAWRTMPMLAARPGRLTRNYIDGQRTRYVSPLALFLFMMFLMFFVVSLTRGEKAGKAGDDAELISFVDKSRSQVEQAESKLAAARDSGADVGAASAALERARAGQLQVEKAAALARAGEPAANADGTPTRSTTLNITTGIKSLDASFKEAGKNPDLAIYKLKSTAGKFTFLLVPLSLPFLWLMFFWRRNVAMYDHAVFVLYSLCFMALLFISVSVLKFFGFKVAALLCFTLVPVHMFLQLRHAYRLNLWGTAWRTVALLFSAACVLGLYLFTILALTVS